MSNCRDVTSRDLLPMEMLLGASAVAWGIAGGYGASGFAQILESQGVDDTWFLVLFLTGALQVTVAMLEWSARMFDVVRKSQGLASTLSNSSLHKYASIRCIAAFASTPAWLYAMYLVIVMAGAGIYAVLILAPTYITFNIWAFFKNLQVRYAIDSRYPTSGLRFLR